MYIGLLGFAIASPVTKSNDAPSALSTISHKIKLIKNLIQKEDYQRHRLQNHLAQSKTNTNTIIKNLTITHAELKKQQALLSHFRDSGQQYQHQLQLQQQALIQAIQAAYQLSRQPYLKLILNQEDHFNINNISRILNYYHYINQAQTQSIQYTQTTLKKIQANQNNIQKQYRKLALLQSHQKNKQVQLMRDQKKNHRLLSILNENIQSRKKQLNQLIYNKHQLEKIIQQLKTPTTLSPSAQWSSKNPMFNWPTQGKVLRLFGTQINQSELRWDGVLIKAPEGQAVHAVEAGKVVFSKWLSGYGLLLIINHGNGYMTLYGHNHALYKQTGDKVSSGEVIASVGQTGGYQDPALYFAIRHDGKPIDPTSIIHKESS